MRKWQHGAALDAKLDHVWAVMNACMQRGLAQQGILPGGLKVKRRAADVLAKLKAEAGRQCHPAPSRDGFSLGLCHGGE